MNGKIILAGTIVLAGFAALTAFTACGITPVECNAECQAEWMDGPAQNDSSFAGLDSYHYYQVSKRPDTLPQSVKDTIPVLIAAHGYTASTFEWLELRRFAGDYQAGATTLVSLVLLGAHGHDIQQFQESSWKTWGKPIVEEYDALVKLGYKNISLAGSSTGCPLILDHISRGRFDTLPPNQVLFIDPIISPASKLLTLIGLVGPILGNSPADATPEEEAHWYHNRPQETLNELYSLTNLIKNRLESGITLPRGTRCKVWKAKKDGLADPIGALMLYKGLRDSEGNRIAVEMVETNKHVFTRLHGRNNPSRADFDLQEKTFREMLDRAKDR
jgi:carboxylesterase